MGTFSIVKVRDSHYLLDLSRPVAQVSPISEREEYTLATLAHCPLSREFIASFRFDHVWNESFLEAIIYQGLGDKVVQDPSVFGERAIILQPNLPIIPQGPCVFRCLSGHLYPVFKLYDDSHRAFIGGILPSNPDQRNVYKWTAITDDEIPVPSRLYSQNMKDHKTLHGMRFALKDNITWLD